MTGGYQHVLDSKNRLFIPAKLRGFLGGVFYVTVSSEKCLWAYPEAAWEELSARVRALSRLQQQKVRPLFANAARCELDSQGRILLTPALIEFAGLVKNVSIVGFNDHAEIWDTDTWNETNAREMSPENIRAAMEEIDF